MVRLIAPIFCWNGRAYQTTSYFNYRPLGYVSGVIEILDRHSVDEIFLSCRTDNQGPDKIILSDLQKSLMATPVCYSGGIRGIPDVKYVLDAGVDRVGINSLLFNKENAQSVITYIGVQGVVAVLPFRISNGSIVEIYNSAERVFSPLKAELIEWLGNVGVEVLLHDVLADGTQLNFNKSVIETFSKNGLILQGGVNASDKDLSSNNLTGFAFENTLMWTENAALHLRFASSKISDRGLL